MGARTAAVEADRDLITDGDRCHVGADFYHGSAALVAQDAGQREWHMAMLDSDVGVAESGSGDLHHHFIGCRLLKVDVGEGERRAHFLHHCGCDLHPLPLTVVRHLPARRFPRQT